MESKATGRPLTFKEQRWTQGEETPGGQRRSCRGGAEWGKVGTWKAALRSGKIKTERGLSSGSRGLMRSPCEGSCRRVVGGGPDFPDINRATGGA